MKPKINVKRGLISLALTAALIVSAIGVKEFMGQYAPTATPGVRVYATEAEPGSESQGPTEDEQKEALTNAIDYIQLARTQLTAFDDANKTLDQKEACLHAASTAIGNANEALDSVTSDDISVTVGSTSYDRATARSLLDNANVELIEDSIALRNMRDIENLSNTVEKCQAAQAAANAAKTALNEQKGHFPLDSRKPEIANTNLSTAQTALADAKTSFSLVAESDITFQVVKEGQTTQYTYAQVKKMVEDTETLVNQAKLAKELCRNN